MLPLVHSRDGPTGPLRAASRLAQQSVPAPSRPMDFRALRLAPRQGTAAQGTIPPQSQNSDLNGIFYSGFSLAWPIQDLSVNGYSTPACFKDAYATSPPLDRLNPDGAITVHMPWHISWASSDRPMLTPTPPALDCGQRISKWIPGESIAQDSCKPENREHQSTSLYFFLVIGLPVILLTLIAGCCAHCCIRRRKEKRPKPGTITTQT